MHIPDNYLSPSTCAAFGAVMIPIWKRAVSKAKEELTKKKMPLLGICAALSFLIMMFNLPLLGGTTSHAVGGTLILYSTLYKLAIFCRISIVSIAVFFQEYSVLHLMPLKYISFWNLSSIITFSSFSAISSILAGSI